jgi:hypothetical protein
MINIGITGQADDRNSSYNFFGLKKDEIIPFEDNFMTFKTWMVASDVIIHLPH